MKIRFQIPVFDAADLETDSSFWAGVLGGDVEREDDWHTIVVDGEPRAAVQLAPDHVPPAWPGSRPPQQVHLDLWVDDFAQAHEHVMNLGARLLMPAQGATGGDDFQVYADPAGHPFCLVFMVGGAPWPRSTKEC